MYKMLKNEKYRKRASKIPTNNNNNNNEHERTTTAVAPNNNNDNAKTTIMEKQDDNSILLVEQETVFHPGLDHLVKSHSADECTNNNAKPGGAFSDDASSIRRTLSDSDGERIFSDLDDDDEDDHFLVSSPLDIDL